MTRRERLENRLERRRDWAAKAQQQSASRSAAANAILDVIPPGQPVLVGHHSEKHHRRDLARVDSHISHAVEAHDRARHHEEKIDGIEHQLERSIFSDDPDAVEQLQAKIEGLEQQRYMMKGANAAWRKAGKPAPDNAEAWAALAQTEGFAGLDCSKIRLAMARHWRPDCPPFESYQLSNLGGQIQQAKAHIAEIERRAERTEAAQASGGVTIDISEDLAYCTVTFTEKPERSVLDALRGAGFYWSGGSWSGHFDRLPDPLRTPPVEETS